MKKNWSLEEVLGKLDRLAANTQPKWGSMSAQRMVEHLTDVIKIASEKELQPVLIPEDKIESMQRFLKSDKPMLRNFEAPFAKKDQELRHEDMELAIDEFTEEWIDFQEVFEQENKVSIHPYYGPLTIELWELLHAKHINHHFTQFGLIPEA